MRSAWRLKQRRSGRGVSFLIATINCEFAYKSVQFPTALAYPRPATASTASHMSGVVGVPPREPLFRLNLDRFYGFRRVYLYNMYRLRCTVVLYLYACTLFYISAGREERELSDNRYYGWYLHTNDKAI